MALNGTYGDHVTLQALACLYKIQFIVLSSLGEEGTRIISPDVSNNFLSTLPALILGHYAETQGTHYVSLQAESEKVFGDLLRSLQLTTVQSEPAGVEKLQEHESLSVLHETAQAADRFVPTVNIDAAGSQEVKYAQNEMNNLKYPKACKNYEQFLGWQRTRPWLKMSPSGSVMCDSCQEIKRLGVHNEQGQHNESAFVDGTVSDCTSAKQLLKKIDKHRQSLAHCKSVEILAAKHADRITETMRNAQVMFEERHKNSILVTEKVFRTAYECAKSHLPFAEHTRLIELQTANGISCGSVLQSDRSCSNIINHVASEMRNEIVKHIVSTKSHFSIMVDESTSVSNTQSMIVYVRTVFEGDVYAYFLGLLPLENATATGLEKTLIEFFCSIGLDNTVMREQLIGLCSDGASSMTGQHAGLAALLKEKFPLLQTFHCMAHRIELAVKNAVDTVNSVSHYRDLIDSIYKVYSQSPKNQREIDIIANSMSIHFLKVKKVFDVRWVFSSFVAIKAVLRDFPALHRHFTESSESQKNAKDKSKFKGLAKKLQSWLFLAETTMLKDALRCLKQLSLYMQRQSASVIDALTHVESTKEKLLAMKETNGKSHAKFIDAYSASSHFEAVEIMKNSTDDKTFKAMRSQFFQALYDNITQRFPATAFLQSATVLDKSLWPTDPLQKAMFGEAEIGDMCKKFHIPSERAAEIVLEYSQYKRGQYTMGAQLKHFELMLKVLPISSADCERGFSQRNLHQTSLRNALYVSTVSDLLMITVNGPSVSNWNPRKYVISWLKTGRHSASDKPTGKRSSKEEDCRSVQLFQ